MTIEGRLILSLILLCLSGLYFFRFRDEIPHLRKIILIFFLFLGGSSILGRLLFFYKPIFAYLFPLPALIILLGLISEIRTALVSLFIFSIFYGFIVLGSFSLTAIHLISSLLAILVIYPHREFRSFLKGAFVLGLLNFSLLFAFGLNFRTFPKFFGLILSSGIYGLSFLLTLGIGINILGPYFRLTSFLQLLGLERSDSPLLKKLKDKAPGTYYHSLHVASLAENAAPLVGADPLVCRVSSYYHDIGKLKNPSLFIENKKREELGVSSKKEIKMLISHVQEGEKLAQKYHLPSEILRTISSHHGTTFYFRTPLGKKTRLEEFRYKGPKPQNKEQALVMLADSVEAATHSLKEITSSSLSSMIEEVFKEKLA